MIKIFYVIICWIFHYIFSVFWNNLICFCLCRNVEEFEWMVVYLDKYERENCIPKHERKFLGLESVWTFSHMMTILLLLQSSCFLLDKLIGRKPIDKTRLGKEQRLGWMGKTILEKILHPHFLSPNPPCGWNQILS